MSSDSSVNITESLHSETLHLVDLPPNLGMNWDILKMKVQWLIKITYDAQTILKSHNTAKDQITCPLVHGVADHCKRDKYTPNEI